MHRVGIKTEARLSADPCNNALLHAIATEPAVANHRGTQVGERKPVFTLQVTG
jgi:hypothetical protein